jgi:hypothetical protein
MDTGKLRHGCIFGIATQCNMMCSQDLQRRSSNMTEIQTSPEWEFPGSCTEKTVYQTLSAEAIFKYLALLLQLQKPGCGCDDANAILDSTLHSTGAQTLHWRAA